MKRELSSPSEYQPGAAPSRPIWVPYFVLTVGLILTLVVTLYMNAAARAKEQLRFDGIVQQTQDSIAARMQTYIAVLRGGSGLYAAADARHSTVSRTGFHAYVQRLDLKRLYPGLRGVGFSRRVLPAERAIFEKRMRARGIAQFRIWPQTPRAEYHAIVYLEPLDRRNSIALGYDMFTNPVRRDAMARARDTGVPVASGKVVLVQNAHAESQPGFLIYAPIYRGGAIPPTQALRRRLLYGFIYSPFRIGELLNGIFGRQADPRVAFQLYDSKVLTPEHLLHDSTPPELKSYEPRFTSQGSLMIAGRHWGLRYSSLPAFEASTEGTLVPFILAAGLLMSGILFRVTWSQAHARLAAEQARSIAEEARAAAERARIAAERSADDLRRSEVALRTSEARARRLIESNIIGVLFADSNGHIVEANDAFLDLVGYPRRALLAREISWEKLTPDDQKMAASQVPEAEKAYMSHAPFEMELLRRDGTRVPVLIGLALINWRQDAEDNEFAKGDALELGFILDLTERKKAEEERNRLLESERAARNEAETANRMKDEFLATLSHELRTPLNAIIGWTHLLRSGKMDEANVDQGLLSIDRNARAQAQLVEDLLDMSRIISGKFRVEVRPTALPPILETAVDGLRPAAAAKNIALETSLDSSCDLISGDPDRLQQVVWNLLSNAIKFTPEGGHVTVRLETDGTMARISVEDSGIGIDPQFLPHIFDRFRQADSSSTRRHGGLGLGLSIVHHMVQLHGGLIHARSAGEGQGSTFTVELPLLKAEAPREKLDSARPVVLREEEEKRPPDALLLRGLKILVVEDETEACALFCKMLQEFGAQVEGVNTASLGIRRFTQWQPDILVSDIGMPGEDGYSFISRIRSANGHSAHIPAVALTAYATEDDRRRILAAGFDRHLAKPVQPQQLAETVAGLAAQKRSG